MRANRPMPALSSPCSRSKSGRAHPVLHPDVICKLKETIMGKYLIAWILGVPAFILVIIYLLFN